MKPVNRASLVSIGIALFLLVQLYLPASYYLGDGGFDERFAWRMFSPVRLASCRVSAYDHGAGQRRPIRLGRELHVVWINLLKRGRTSVVDEAIEHLCTSRGGPGVADVRMELNCGAPHGVSLGICVDRQDRNADGIPDGYSTAPACRGQEPAACFARDCGDSTPGDCHTARCKVQLLDGGENLCARVGT